MERELTFREKVAVHETGHVIGAEKKGVVKRVTVIPEGNAAGLTEFALPGLPLKEALEERMIIACLGYVAEEKVGIKDHSGTGSDMFWLHTWAMESSQRLNKGMLPAEYYIVGAFQKARLRLPSIGEIMFRAKKLESAGTIV